MTQFAISEDCFIVDAQAEKERLEIEAMLQRLAASDERQRQCAARAEASQAAIALTSENVRQMQELNEELIVAIDTVGKAAAGSFTSAIRQGV